MTTSADSSADTEIVQQLFGHGHGRSDQKSDHPPARIVPENEARKHKLRIRIELESRPQYIGGHGPPLTKLLLQPEHKKKNLMISDYVEKERGKAVYIVCSRKDRLKYREVSPEDILKWVSQRNLEEFSVREYERYEEIERVKEQKEKAEEFAVMFDRHGNPRSTRKKAAGRPRKSRQVSEEADEDNFGEVMPAKKNRAERRMAMEIAEASESEVDAAPSLSQQPSLSQRPSLSRPRPSTKRKLSQLFSKESTPEESADEIEAIETRRQSRKLSIRERPSRSPQAKRNASSETRERGTPSVEIPVRKSPFRNPPSFSPSRQFSKSSNGIRKESSAPATIPVHASGSGNSSRNPSSSPPASMPPLASGSQTRIIPGTPKKFFPVFGGMDKPTSSSEQPRSSSKILPPERKKIPSSAPKTSRR